MTHVLISGIAIALTLGLAPLSYAQVGPAGYLSLDQYTSVTSEGKLSSAQDSAIPVFTVERGASLRTTLEGWAAKAGWQEISWKLPEDTDFTLGASHTFNGDFVSVVRAFVDSLSAEAELRVRFNQGNRLMVVEPLK